MRHVRWLLCIALAGLLGGTAAGAEERPPTPEELNALLQKAAQAYGRGDAAEARRELRAALGRLSPQDFQRRLLHVSQLHDDGRASQASSALHMAAQMLTPWLWFAVGAQVAPVEDEAAVAGDHARAVALERVVASLLQLRSVHSHVLGACLGPIGHGPRAFSGHGRRNQG